MDRQNRPLSPHLQIYRPQVTSVLSLMHRITGLLLGIGTLLLVYWLVAIAAGPELYAETQAFLSSWFGQLLLLVWSFALFYHLCSGIRHLFWDAGWGFDMPTVYTSGKAVLIATVLLTLLTWFLAYAMMGTGS
jgi:succinate dehydrogenase / fumarate reductase cytochrome b subunit